MNRTLTGHLLAWALAALAGVWIGFVVVGYRTGGHEADELTDGHLASVASLLLAYRGGGFEAGEPLARAAPAAQLKAHDYQQSLSVAIWDAAGQVLTRTGAAPLPPFDDAEGFATLQLGAPATPWRTFARWSPQRDRKVMVLLAQGERDDLADDIAGQVMEPGLWLLPVFALVLVLAIWRGLRPLYRLSSAVRALDVRHAQPLPRMARHRELVAVTEAIDALVVRYREALERERDLADEFAHELRTPLASLSLQVRSLRTLPPGPGRDDALARLENDAARAAEVLSHLLALARAGRTGLDEAAQPVDVSAVARRLVADAAPAADAGGRELSLVAPQALVVGGYEVLVELALRNLLENALGHTPRGTQVEVRVDAAGRWVEVCDRAPDAGAARAEAAVARAAAPLGLGLGLRVVERVAARHGAVFDVRETADGRCCRLRFAASAQGPDAGGLRST